MFISKICSFGRLQLAFVPKAPPLQNNYGKAGMSIVPQYLGSYGAHAILTIKKEDMKHNVQIGTCN